MRGRGQTQQSRLTYFHLSVWFRLLCSAMLQGCCARRRVLHFIKGSPMHYVHCRQYSIHKYVWKRFLFHRTVRNEDNLQSTSKCFVFCADAAPSILRPSNWVRKKLFIHLPNFQAKRISPLQPECGILFQHRMKCTKPAKNIEMDAALVHFSLFNYFFCYFTKWTFNIKATVGQT